MRRIDDALSVRDGRLQLEDRDLVALAEEFGTPVFVISADQIRRNYRRLQSAFAERWPEGAVHVLPAFKAAPYLAVRQILSDEGAGSDTFGPSELEGAVRGGVDPALISVNGSVKSAETIRRGVALGARIVIDAPRELEICAEEAAALGKRARVLFRIKPELEGLEVESDFAPVPIRELVQRVRYGLPGNEVRPLGAQVAESPHVELIGFHAHIGRQSTQLVVWESYARATVGLIADLVKEWGWGGWSPQILDLGGGYAPPRNYDTDHHRTGELAPPIEDYAQAITTALRQALAVHGMRAEGVALDIEPGRGLHSDTGVHLSRVINVKRATRAAGQTWIELDTSEQFLGTYAMDPSTHPFRFIVASQADVSATETADIVGMSCGGEMLLLDAEVPALAHGDLIALQDTGAYIESLACNFNALPRPGTVLVSGDRADWIRMPESIDQVYARDRMPAGLVHP